MRELPKCGNALSMEGGSVTCGLGLYGGTPHIGVCMECIKSKPATGEIKYQREVLARMVKRGCKPCEARRQREHIQRLQDEQTN